MERMIFPPKRKRDNEQFVTRDEIEKIKKEIEYSAMSEARKRSFLYLGELWRE